MLESCELDSSSRRRMRTDVYFVRNSEGRMEGNVLFNDALNTFYLQLYGVRHMVKDRSDRERKPAAAT